VIAPCLLDGIFATVDNVDLVAIEVEHVGESLGEIPVVINHQDSRVAHSAISSRLSLLEGGDLGREARHTNSHDYPAGAFGTVVALVTELMESGNPFPERGVQQVGHNYQRGHKSKSNLK
jgi:hypothetical protein